MEVHLLQQQKATIEYRQDLDKLKEQTASQDHKMHENSERIAALNSQYAETQEENIRHQENYKSIQDQIRAMEIESQRLEAENNAMEENIRRNNEMLENLAKQRRKTYSSGCCCLL
jgi:chromosome segregation ATPase